MDLKDVECDGIFNSRRTNNHKRVSFSSPSSSNQKEELNWNLNKKEQKQQKSVKPILTRRNSCRSNRNNNASTSFRNRVGTSLSVGGCHDDENDYYSVIRMDYAMVIKLIIPEGLLFFPEKLLIFPELFNRFPENILFNKFSGNINRLSGKFIKYYKLMLPESLLILPENLLFFPESLYS